ncbi:MAG: methionyl-tRNA formyltransferase [Clostridia bacterium]|nr:methionyl-tRNA formyltransferase [Clostridia bacterium]
MRRCSYDLIVVCAYGLILPKEVLDIPTFGCLNIHASVLPRWRGAAPIHRAILAGDETIGVSIMRMEEGLDTGDYYVVGEIEILNKGIDQIIEELSKLGAIGIMEVIERLSYEFLNSFTVQNEALSTYANKIDKLEVLLDPFLDIDTFLRRVHLSSASLPARCIICGREVIVLDAHPIEENLASGVVRLEKKRILIGVDGIAVQIDSIKPKGKNIMDGLSFKSGLHDVEFTWTSIQF